ncbi:hypothetical protein ACRQF6_02970 [Actinotignum sp. GS-2025f]|uniref:hypothetical protein n=1 Tax=Actinotignum TaxID=1653174 RepID=UPI00254A3478|nr:hypothetical protein [Actinotignum timonense]MDK8283228.1 hypothetical protein [Actinotignum timonense]
MFTQLSTLEAYLHAALLPFIEVTPTQPPGTEKITQILGYVAWGAGVLCLLGIFIVAGKLAINARHGEGLEEAKGLLWVLAALVLIGSATSLIGAFITL